jgi:hypothetical protein
MVAEAVHRLVPIVAQAIAVFGDERKASHWFDTPLPLFDNRTPSELLETEEGKRSSSRPCYGSSTTFRPDARAPLSRLPRQACKTGWLRRDAGRRAMELSRPCSSLLG